MINWGIIGLGKIAHTFLESHNEINSSKILAISSLTKKSPNELSSRFNISNDYFFNNYDDLLKCKEINAVYIATLNNTHAKIINKAIDANKHILCEKPLSINYKEANEVYNKLSKSNNFFLEAYAYRSHPQTHALCELITNKEIGIINKVVTSFGYKSKKINPKSRIFNKELGGGAILDVGCYTSSLSLLIAKTTGVKDLSNFQLKNIKRSFSITGVDDEAEADLFFNNDIKFKLKASIKNQMENICTIYGSKGKIVIKSPWLPERKCFIEVYREKSYYKKFINSDYSVYANQILSFNNNILKINENTQKTLMTPKDSLINLNIIDQWKNI